MPSTFPSSPDNVATGKTNATLKRNDHPAHHNKMAEAINAIQAAVTSTPGASKIPLAGSDGKLASGWLTEVLAMSDLSDVAGSFAEGAMLARNSTGFAPSGLRFSATAYGCDPDGTAADNATALNACIDAAVEAGDGATVWLDWVGTLETTGGHKIYSRIIYEGNVFNKLKLASSSTAGTHLLKTASFDDLTQTRPASVTEAGEYEFVVRNIILDGNKAGNANGGLPLAIVGYGYHLDMLLLENGACGNWWTEYGRSDEPIGEVEGSLRGRCFYAGRIMSWNAGCNTIAAVNTRLTDGKAAVQSAGVMLFGPGDSWIDYIEIVRNDTPDGVGIRVGELDFDSASSNAFSQTINNLTVWLNHRTAVWVEAADLTVNYIHSEGSWVNFWNDGAQQTKIKSGKIFGPRAKTTISGTTTSSSATVSVSDVQQIAVGQVVSGTGIQSNTYITSVDRSAETFTMSRTATASGTNTLTIGGSNLVIHSGGNFADINVTMNGSFSDGMAYLVTSSSSCVDATIVIRAELAHAGIAVHATYGAIPENANEIDYLLNNYSGTSTITGGWVPQVPVGGVTWRLFRRRTFQPMTATATAVAGAATCDSPSGTVTSESLTTAAGSDYTLTLSNDYVLSTSRVFASVDNGTNTTEGLMVCRVTPSDGQVVILVRNVHASSALNGTIKISFFVLT